MEKEFKKFTPLDNKYLYLTRFAKSDFGLEIWSKREVIFKSKKESIQGLLEFIEKNGKTQKVLTVFDKKIGNAVALLCVYLGTNEVFGIIGSETAKETLENSKIKFYFLKTIPYMLNRNKTDICPIEKLSFSKTPEVFLDLLKEKGFC